MLVRPLVWATLQASCGSHVLDRPRCDISRHWKPISPHHAGGVGHLRGGTVDRSVGNVADGPLSEDFQNLNDQWQGATMRRFPVGDLTTWNVD
jgi:hypothetical protein